MDKAVRDNLRQTFLNATGWGMARQDALPGDASHRRYIRLNKNGERAMLMDAPPPTEDVRPFTHIARHLTDQGFSAPQIWGEDETNGFLIIEDFGDDTFTNLLHQGEDEDALYTLATDTLAHLHTLSPPSGVASYDTDHLLAETALLPDWFMAARNLSGDRQSYDQAWRGVFAELQGQPETLVLRDYHVDNLMRLNGRDGLSACGLLDFQDALIGHPAYDLMSLLEDARRDVDVGLQARLKDRYHSTRGTQNLDQFEAAYAILAAGRHAKVIGIFTRLDRRDGKPHYLKHIDRVWRLFEHSLEHPALAPVKTWIDHHILPKDRS